MLTNLIDPENDLDFPAVSEQIATSSLDNLTDHLRRALNNNNHNTSYQISEGDYDPERNARQSYANGPRTVSNSLIASMQ